MSAGPSEVTDVELAQLACVDIYNPTEHGITLQEIGGVFFAVVKVRDHDVVVFRGSQVKNDWFRDFQVLGPVRVTGLGCVHRGFYRGLQSVLDAIFPTLSPSVYVTGHSLGAGEAPIFSLMLDRAGLTPRACIMFAPPRPGYEDFRDSLILTGMELRAYRNNGDPVPHAPLPILPLHPWAHVCPLFDINVPPAPHELDALRCHHGALYYEGLKLLTGV